jgi:hypothetical protein
MHCTLPIVMAIQVKVIMHIRKIVRGATALMGCALGLTACGGNHNAPTAEQQLQAMEQHGTLPKLDISNSLTGTDADGNGVRDDVDKLISAQPDMPAQRAALTQMAHSIQASLTSDATTVAATADLMNRAVACVFSQYEASKAAGQIKWIEEISINTLPRLNAYEAFNKAMSGSVTHSAKGVTCNV